MTYLCRIKNVIMENIEQYIIGQANKVLGTNNTTIVKRLEGGMSNYTYVIQADGNKYTYRVPGKFAEKFVDRDIEKANIDKVDTLGLNNKTTYFDIASGEKMAEYIEGTILSDTDISSYDTISAKALKSLHDSNLKFQDYDAFGRLDQYEQYCRELNHVHPDAYKQLRHDLDALHTTYADIPQVPCHCDYQPTNLVLSGDKLYVFDWEYAGMNDPFYDIACYGNAGIDKALSLFEAYLGHTPTKAELSRLYFWRTFQCLQWYNVAVFKDITGLGKDLNIDFMGVANMFVRMAQQLIELAQNDTNTSKVESLNIYGNSTAN